MEKIYYQRRDDFYFTKLFIKGIMLLGALGAGYVYLVVCMSLGS